MTPLDALTALRIAGKFLWMHKAWAIIAVLGLMLLFAKMDARHWHKRADQCSAARVADHRAWQEAYDKAVAADKAHIAAVKARDDQINQEKTHALESQLVDARAAVARYARLHPAPQANPGSAGAAAVPAASDPASFADGTGQEAIVPVSDLAICSDAVVKAEGWRDWWAAVSTAPR